MKASLEIQENRPPVGMAILRGEDFVVEMAIDSNT